MSAKLRGLMGFSRTQDVVPDTERKGRLRAVTDSSHYDQQSEFIDFKQCKLNDLASWEFRIDFSKAGFDSIDLRQQPLLKPVLDCVHAQGRLDETAIVELRRLFARSTFTLSNGKRLRVAYVAGDGVLFRNSGPNGLTIDQVNAAPDNSKHNAASQVHGDQDVYGFPIKRIMKGLAPWVFHHDSPGGRNTFSPINLVNIWIPLQQITMPLCLMDRSTLDKQKHQLRFEINVQDVLQRQAYKTRNDIWTFLYDEQQDWYFNSEMNSDSAYVFDTLGIPHGAAILPGEVAAERYYLALQACQTALSKNDRQGFLHVASIDKQDGVKTTRRLEEALHVMEELLATARNDADALFAEPTLWNQAVEAVKRSLVRKSLELRAVGIVY